MELIKMKNGGKDLWTSIRYSLLCIGVSAMFDEFQKAALHLGHRYIVAHESRFPTITSGLNSE